MIGFLLITNAAAQLTSAANGFVPANPDCVTMKSNLCADPYCILYDQNIAAGTIEQLGMDPTTAEIPAGMDANFAPLWAMVSFLGTQDPMIDADTGVPAGPAPGHVYPALDAVYECEARFAGLIWNDFAGGYKAMQTCFASTECATAWASMKLKSETGDVDVGTVQDKGAIWMAPFDGVPIFIPDPTPGVNTIDNFCNMFYAALEIENAESIYLLGAMLGLMVPNGDEIVTYCNEDIEAGIVSTVKKVVMMMVGVSGAVGLILGSAVCGVGCYCYNSGKSKVQGGI